LRRPGSIETNFDASQSLAANAQTSVPGAARDSTVRWVWLLLLAHLVIWTVTPTLANRNLSLDSVEMWVWGNHCTWGYYKHPPLPAWCARGLATLLGRSDITLYFGCQCAVVLTMWSVWRLARRWLTPWSAMMAVWLLETCYFLNWRSVRFNNNTLNLPWWALTALAFHTALTRGRRRDWIATGVVLALGMYTKYDIAFLALSIVGVLLLLPSARPKLRTPGPYLMVATALALFAPHMVWMVSEHFPTIQYALDRSQHAGHLSDHVVHPFGFLASQAAAFLPMILVLWPVFGGKWKWRNLAGSERFSREFILGMAVGPIALYLLLSLATGARLDGGWGSPLWMFWPLLLLTCFEITANTAALHRAFYRTAMIALALPLLFSVQRLAAPYVLHRADHVAFPGRALAAEVEKAWQAECSTPMAWIGGDWWIAGNAAFYARQSPRVYGDLDPRVTPGASDEQFRAAGGMLVWFQNPDHPEPPAEWQQRFPAMRILPPIEIPYQTRAHLPLARFGMAIVPARGSLFAANKDDRTARQPSNGPAMR
jgi:4-amino-4-deoxy-L-arabinose transferase-like glycosyltransferase